MANNYLKKPTVPGEHLITANDAASVLKFAEEIGILNCSSAYVVELMHMKEQEKALEEHPYKVWQGKDGRWRTYVDDTFTKERKLVAKKNRNDLNEIIIKSYYENQSVHVEDVFYEWIAYSVGQKDIEKNTADRYENDFNKYIKDRDFAKMDIRNVTAKDVRGFLKSVVNDEEHKITRKAFSNLKMVVKGIFNYACTERNFDCVSIKYALEDFRVSEKKFKKVIMKDAEQVFSEEESLMLANYILEHYTNTRELGVLFALLTGLRVGELVSLKYEDFSNDKKLYVQRTEIKYKDENGKTVYDVRDFPKNEGSMAPIQLSDSAVKVLYLIKRLNMKNGNCSDYLFYEEKYGRLKTYFFDRTIRKLCKILEIPQRSMHKLRKTYASYLFANGVEEKIAQQQMRHKDSITTHKYYEFSMRSNEYKRDMINKADLLLVNQV